MRPWLVWALRSVVALSLIYSFFAFYLLPFTKQDSDPDGRNIGSNSHITVSFNISELTSSGCISAGSWGDIYSDPMLVVSDCDKTTLYYTNSNINLFEPNYTFSGAASISSCWGDINGDGWDDVMLVGKGEDKMYINHEGILVRNESYFKDVTLDEGQFCIMADVTNDGVLDVIRISTKNELTFLKNDKQRFKDITKSTGIMTRVGAFVATAQNVMILISPSGTLHLFDRTTKPYADISNQFIGLPINVTSAVSYDMNNDLAFDIICLADNSPPIISYNVGNYSMFSVTLPNFPDLYSAYTPQDLVILDYNNDMLSDIFVSVTTHRATNHYLYINKGDNFVVAKVGETDLYSFAVNPRALAVSDFNFDGIVDVSFFGKSAFMFVNNHPPRHNANWIQIELVVIESDTMNGLQVGIVANNVTQLQIVQFSQNAHKRIHFGIGNATVVDHVWVRWRAFTQRYFDYKANQLVTLLSPFAYKYDRAVNLVGARPQVELQCNPGGTRLRPSFLILGIYKSGTTTLAASLARHPGIVLGSCKEIHYFDEMYRGTPIEWYWSQFPCNYENYTTFDATAGYLYFKSVPPLVKKHLPNAKFLVLLRDPVERMYSHFHMNTYTHWEGPAKFDQVARETIAKFQSCIDKLKIKGHFCNISDTNTTNEPGSPSSSSPPSPSPSPPSCKTFSVLDTEPCTGGNRNFLPFYAGIYYFAVQRWFALFPREQFMFIHYPDLSKNWSQVLHEIELFIGVDTVPVEIFSTNISPKREPMWESTRQMLSDVYKPYNLLLYDLLQDFGWDKPKIKT